MAKPRDNPEVDGGFEHIWSRRSCFSAAGWISLTGVLGAWILGFARFLYPRVLFEPATTFRAGWPAEYRRGEVSVRYAAEQRVWIVREDDGSDYLRSYLRQPVAVRPRLRVRTAGHRHPELRASGVPRSGGHRRWNDYR